MLPFTIGLLLLATACSVNTAATSRASRSGVAALHPVLQPAVSSSSSSEEMGSSNQLVPDLAAEAVPSSKALMSAVEKHPSAAPSWIEKLWIELVAGPNPRPVPVRTFCKPGEENNGQSGLTALLLAIFLGWCGAPRFFYGYYGTAVMHLIMLFAPCVVLMFTCCAGAFSQIQELSRFRRLSTSEAAADNVEAQANSTASEGQTEDMEVQNPLKLGVGLCCGVCCSLTWVAAAIIWSVVDIVLVANYSLYPQHGHCLIKI